VTYDKIIIGAGIYGLYSSLFCSNLGQKVLIIEYDSEPFKRATYINQARVHMGYHYPRSFSTAIKSAHYFERFNKDYSYCIHSKFDQIYATSTNFSWTNAKQFQKFCKDAGIRCEEVSPQNYFQSGMCDGAFMTEEYTYDAQVLKSELWTQVQQSKNIEIILDARIEEITKDETYYYISLKDNSKVFESTFVLNATYASGNQILKKLNYDTFKIKYELCEIILCDINEKLNNIGITVMDGPFFSIMPFGKTGFHSLTSVTFTPHTTSYNELPIFSCQNGNEQFCSPLQLGNCNDCLQKPESAWSYMSSLAEKYLLEEYSFKYKSSLFSMKPILKASEIDDSRPTVIKYFSNKPTFISILSGKINTIYDLDEVLR
jgi:hypothetical protein